MHWIVQENFWCEHNYDNLILTLERFNIPHTIVKVIPFIGEIQPDVSPEGHVMVYGSYSMRHVAVKKGWVPGVFSMEKGQYREQKQYWDDYLLNYDASIFTFGSFEPENDEFFFIRPYEDSKTFAGTTMDGKEFRSWKNRIINLKEDDGSTITANTEILVSNPKNIKKEFRFWIVDSNVVTWSLYKQGHRVIYSSEVDDGAWQLATRVAAGHWQPSRAYVLDIALTEINYSNQYRIVEAQCINASGLYAADVQKLVMALEDMYAY